MYIYVHALDCLNANKQHAYIRKTKQKSSLNQHGIVLILAFVSTQTNNTPLQKKTKKFSDWEQTRDGILQTLSNKVGMKSQHVYTIPTPFAVLSPYSSLYMPYQTIHTD